MRGRYSHPKTGAKSSRTEAGDGFSRRRLLQAVGAGGAATLAGCTGGDDDDSTTDEGDDVDDVDAGDDTADDGESADDDSDTADERVDRALTEPTTDTPTDWQFNVFNPSQEFGHAMNNDQFVWYHSGRDEFEWRLVEVAELEPGHAVVEMEDDRYWHDDGERGRNVDAEDLRTKLIMENIMGSDLGVLYEDVEITGDHTVELDLPGEINPEVFYTGWTNMWLETRAEQYEEFVERWEDGEEELRPELENMTLEEIEGHGPFEVVEITDTRLRMELFEDHPDAENINWQYWDLDRVGADTTQVVLGNEVDAIRNLTAEESILESRPDDLTVGFLPALWGLALPFNHDHEDFGNVRVRQAITEFIDRDGVANSYGRYGEAVQVPSGLLGNIDSENEPTDEWRDWVSEDAADMLYEYDDPERGRRLLEEEGYELDDGEWYRPDGERFELVIKIPANITDWHPVYQTIEGQLRQEGIDSSIQAIDDTTYWPNHYLDGNYDLAATGWTLQNAYPYFTFNMYYNIDAPFLNLDSEELEAPPMGEPDGELERVDVDGLMEDLRVADEDEAEELIGELAWITNQTLPLLPVTEINDTVWFWEDEWSVPDPEEDSELYQSKWPLWRFPREGHLQARTE